MSAERGARASISRSLLHGLVGWGFLLCIAAAVVVTRLHTAEANRAPLPMVTASLSAGQHREWASFPDYHRRVPVLMYHSIGGKASYLTVSRKLFAEQMRALKVAGFHTLTIEQYAHFVKHGYRGLPSRPILLTFDDGREDAYRAANDLLQAYGFHVTELVVPAWVTGHPHFSLSWSQLQQMAHTSTWDVQLHFGYGREEIRWNHAGDTGAAFAYQQYFPGQNGEPGHEETFAQYQKRIASNMEWGERQLEKKVPGYKPWSMAIPESDYGQAGTNDKRIPPFVLGWLDRHFPVVFGGDYLDKAVGRLWQIPGRYSPRLSYRMSIGPQDSLAVLHCRLMDYLHHVAIWKEYACQRLAGIAPSVLAATRAPIHPRTAVSDGPPPPPQPHTVNRVPAQISARAIRGPRVLIGSRPGWRVAIRATPAPSAGRPPRRG
jgi:hypothetical protein